MNDETFLNECRITSYTKWFFSCQYLQFWITTDGNSNSIKKAQAYNAIRVHCINKQIIHKINVKFDCINLFNISRLRYYCTNQDHKKAALFGGASFNNQLSRGQVFWQRSNCEPGLGFCKVLILRLNLLRSTVKNQVFERKMKKKLRYLF